MNLQLPVALAAAYQSKSQRIRVMTERWAREQVFCPACLGAITATPPNTPATDFLCSTCTQSFELKSKSGAFGPRIVDGAYSTMSMRITTGTQPHLFLLSYTPAFQVYQLEVIPKSFLTLPIIQKRTPLAATAQRSGWVGCNIVITSVPRDGRIAYVRNSLPIAPDLVRKQWRQSDFLETIDLQSRGWLVATMNCVRQLGRRRFSLREMYAFETKLQEQFPNNRHIKPKIRQQLQVLRDAGWLTFEGTGRYSVSAN